MRIGLLAPSRRYEDSFLRPAEALFRASGDNLGNFAFVEALWRHLSPNATLLPFHVSREEARETCDLLVLAAANQLGPHSDLGAFADHLEAIGLPIVVAGLGAQAPSLAASVELTPGTERWARVLAGLAPTRRPNIGLRGEFTRRVMERLGLADRVSTIGCPSHFLNDAPDFYATLKRRFERRRVDRLGVAAGGRHFYAVREAERRLARLVAETGGLYVVQADLDLLRWARGEAIPAAEEEAIRAYLAPGATAEAFALFRQRCAVSYQDATAWADAMRVCDFVVGPRFHGVMLALQAGVPGGVIAHDSRTLELCQTMALPVRLAGEIPPTLGLGDLHSLFDLDVAAFAATRERLRRVYVEFWRGAGVEPNARLATLQAAA